MDARAERSRFHALAAAGLLVTLLGACGGSAANVPTPSPVIPDATARPVASPTPTYRPTPSATPDVAAAFRRELARLRSARITLEGEVSVGGMVVPLEGHQQLSGADYSITQSVGVGDAATESSVTVVGGETFSSLEGGPWYRQEPVAATAPPGGEILDSLGELEDAGLVSRDGRRLHHLRLPRGVEFPPELLGLTGDDYRDARATIDVFVEDDGTLVQSEMTGTWQQPTDGGSQDAALRITMTYHELNRPVTVPVPEDVWTTYVSERFAYGFSHPETWTIEEDEELDYFATPDGFELNVSMQRDVGDLNEWTSGSIRTWQDDYGARPETNEEMTVGGAPARLLTYHVEDEWGPFLFMDAAVVHEDRGYDILWFSPRGREREDRERFEAILATFTFR